MNPWTAILESMHSALVDEITDRHPEPKPELGMPVRDREFRLPDASLSTVLAAAVEIAGQKGAVYLATDPGFSKGLKLKESELWSALLIRAGTEFERRSIKPVFQPPVLILAKQRTAMLPAHISQPGRLVWIPFKLPAGSCFLGLGV